MVTFPTCNKPRPQFSASDRIPDSIGQGGHRNSRGQVIFWFLLPALPRPKAKSTVEAGHRPKPAQQIYMDPQVQDEHPIKKISSPLRKGRRVFSLDLKDAYFQIPIHPTSRKYLSLEFRNTVFQCSCSELFLWGSVRLFTKVVGVVKEIFHRDGLSLFLDNWLGDPNQGRGCTQIPTGSKALLSLGVPDQLPEVQTSSHSGVRFHGDALQPASWNGVRHQEELGQGRSDSGKPESGRSGSGSTMAISGWNTPGQA